MALINGVNFRMINMDSQKCSGRSEQCEFYAVCILISRRRGDPPRYYCWKHLLHASKNIHSIENVRRSWL